MFDREFGYVCRCLHRLGVREADLKDVSQELFVTVHDRMGEFDPARPIRRWLFSFAVRFASNYRRLARNRVEVIGDPGEGASRTDGSATQDLEHRDLVLRALAALEFDRRILVVMHDIEGYSAPEIAAELGIPLNTVYSRLRLGRVDFKAAVDALSSTVEAS